jgi:oligosaccharide repeat unit polymerase
MIGLFLILNLVAAVWGGRVLFQQTRNYVIYLFEAVFVMFFVVRPLTVSYFGVLSPDLVRFGIDDESVFTYVLCGLVFAVVFHLIVYRLYRLPRLFSDRFFRVCDFEGVSASRFNFVLLMFVVITYGVNVFKFHSATYFLENLDAFSAGVNLVNGLWFVEVLSGIMIFPLLVLLGKNLEAKPWRLFYLLLVTMILFSVIAKPSTRTGTIAILLAVAVYLFSTGKIKVNLISVGVTSICAILLLVYLDFLRSNNLGASALLTSVSSILIAAYNNVSPADNAMILIDYLKHHSWLYFRYLLPSLSPTSLVPSVILPLKPRTDIEASLTYELFGFNLDPIFYGEGSTLTYTVPGAGYANFSFLGVVVAAIIYGFIFSVFLRGWKSKSLSVRFVTLYYLIILIAGLRLSVEALMGSFYWVLLATWWMHFVSCFRFLRPTRVSGREAAAVTRVADSSAAS